MPPRQPENCVTGREDQGRLRQPLADLAGRFVPQQNLKERDLRHISSEHRNANGQRRRQHHHIGAVARRLQTQVVPFPGKTQIGVATLPGMRPGKNLGK